MPTFVHSAPAVEAIEGKDPNHVPILAAAGNDSAPLIIDGEEIDESEILY